MKRKYTKHGENPSKYECTKTKCKWQGTQDEQIEVKTDSEYHIYELACPKCGNNEFYGIL